jgi:hypothetical protein
MKSFFIRLVSDSNGTISSARFLNLLVGVCACLFCWKLVLLGGFSEGYLGLLLAYGGGTYSWGKFVESKGGRNEPSQSS